MNFLIEPIGQYLFRAADEMEMLYLTADPFWAPRNRQLPLSPCAARETRARRLAADNSPERPTAISLARIVWDPADRQRQRTLWCFRRTSPTTAVLSLHLWAADVQVNDLLSGSMTEGDSDRLFVASGTLAGAPIPLCSAPTATSFTTALAIPRWRCKLVNSVCDWTLSSKDRNAARESGLRVLAPARSSDGRRADDGS